MPDLLGLLSPIVGMRPSLLFTSLVVVHVLAGLICVIAGAVAMLSTKQRGRHPLFGTVYYASLSVVFVTASAMAGLRWSEDAYLLVLGTIAFGAGSLGYLARRIRWPRWLGAHLVGMGISYIVLLTAFYLDNGPKLPLYDLLPPLTFWIVPSLIGLPLVFRALTRHAPRGDRAVRASGDAALLGDLRRKRVLDAQVGQDEPSGAALGSLCTPTRP